MDRSYIADNKRTRERLVALIDRLSDEDLNRLLGDGWTIASTLAHIAFWDFRVLALLDRWQTMSVEPSPIDPDILNAAIQPLCQALPAREAARLCLEAAHALDGHLETLSPEILAAIEAAGRPINLRRSEHRDDHLPQIERALASR
jgi:hypothetical protein